MRRFIRTFIIFLIPVIPLSFCLDYIISEKLKEGKSMAGEFEVWNDIYNSKIEAEIAVYGSSRAWVHIDPQIIEEELNYSAYNLGIDGHAFRTQYLRHQEYFKNCKIPKIIILTVDEHSFGVGNNRYNSDQFLPFLLWELNPLKANLTYENFTFLETIVPLLRYSGKGDFILSSIYFSDEENFRKKGYKGIEQEWNDDLLNAQMESDSYSIKVDDFAVNLFQDLIISLKEQNVELILVNTPEYIEGQNYIVNREEIIRMIGFIAEKQDIPFLDYSNDSLSFNKNMFYNSMHLNKTGAELFTKKLVSYLQQNNLITPKE